MVNNEQPFNRWETAFVEIEIQSETSSTVLRRWKTEPETCSAVCIVRFLILLCFLCNLVQFQTTLNYFCCVWLGNELLLFETRLLVNGARLFFCWFRATSHTRLKAHDHCNLRAPIGRKGGDRPSSLHTWRWRRKGPKKTSWMKSLRGVLHK